MSPDPYLTLDGQVVSIVHDWRLPSGERYYEVLTERGTTRFAFASRLMVVAA